MEPIKEDDEDINNNNKRNSGFTDVLEVLEECISDIDRSIQEVKDSSYITSNQKTINIYNCTGIVPFIITQGSENCQLICIESITYPEICPEINIGDVLISVEDRLFPGLTRNEAFLILDELFSFYDHISICIISPHLIPVNLSHLLNDIKFLSLHHIIRTNIYFNNVPYTTKELDDEEISGEYYNHVSYDDFMFLVKNNMLLEYGEYKGHLYGTPVPRNANMISDSRGPLPPNWEIAYSDAGERYFVDHNTGTTQWNDPRDEILPPGWEKVDDEVHGTFYVNHNTKTTQYNKPSYQQLERNDGFSNQNEYSSENCTYNGESNNIEMYQQKEVKNLNESQGYGLIGTHPTKAIYTYNTITTNIVNDPTTSIPINRKHINTYDIDKNYGNLKIDDRDNFNKSLTSQYEFTRYVSKLKGQIYKTAIVKGPKGLGFTLIGNDGGSDNEEFIQIKGIIPNSPAELNGVLKPADVLVSVNKQLMLGATQEEACEIFRNIPIGETVCIEICRGYPFLIPVNNKVVTENIYASSASLKQQYNYFTVTTKKTNQGFGFTIGDSIGGHQIKSLIHPLQCPNLQEKDIILEIDNIKVHNLSHEEVIHILHEYPPNSIVMLLVKRLAIRHRSKTPTPGFRYGETFQKNSITTNSRSKTPGPKSSTISGRRNDRTIIGIQSNNFYNNVKNDNFNRLKQSNTTLDFTSVPTYVPINYNGNSKKIVVNLIKKHNGFGFRLYGGAEANTDLSVREIIRGEAADLDGRLKVGDKIVEIDNISVIGYTHEKALELIKKSFENGHIKLVVERPSENISNGILPRSVSLPLNQHPPLSNSSLPYDVVLTKRDEEEFGCVIISLKERNGSYIGNVLPNTPAYRNGKIRIGDNVIAVNGIPTINLSHLQVINLIKNSGHQVCLTIDPTGFLVIDRNAKYNDILEYAQHVKNDYDINYHNDNNSIQNYGRHYNPSRIIDIDKFNINDERKSYSITKQTEGLYGQGTIYQKGTPLYSASGTHYNPLPSMDKGSAAESLISIRLVKGNKGFGFSIRGGWEFGKMPLFVLRIADDGPAALDGRLRLSDQIIEINGISTKEMTHKRAIELILQNPEVTLLVSRKVYT
ncbi:LD27118p [Strongyloides ratti]|uniref:LD27118p n=1 Tax=Strongyloides ratti TaxID=34506 RepID=A0A090KTF1_STRRB|nr:LD27118p [Strongyloides ratti]CEF60770.1 LD27118p [Strongyloides ratti]